MEKFIVERVDGFDHIVCTEFNFTLIVIPPELMPKNFDDYPAGSVVTGLYQDDTPPELPDEWEDLDAAYPDDEDSNDTVGRHCFAGIKTLIDDRSRPNGNYWQWLEAVNYYCQTRLDHCVIMLWTQNGTVDCDIYDNDGSLLDELTS